jgi:hypothetical protein
MNAGDIPYFAYFIVSFALACAGIGALWLIGYGIKRLICWIDGGKPCRYEHLPARKRRIVRNGFKSQIGAR